MDTQTLTQAGYIYREQKNKAPSIDTEGRNVPLRQRESQQFMSLPTLIYLLSDGSGSQRIQSLTNQFKVIMQSCQFYTVL